MIYLAALLVSPWLHRVLHAPLDERVYRADVFFRLVVISAAIALLTAAVLQAFSVPTPVPLPLAAGRARV